MKPSKRRAVVKRLGGTSRTARRANEEWLAQRRAAVAAWRKTPKAFERFKERIRAELEKAAPLFEALSAPIDEFEGVSIGVGMAETPLALFETLASELEAALDAHEESDFEQEIAETKAAKRE